MCIKDWMRKMTIQSYKGFKERGYFEDYYPQCSSIERIIFLISKLLKTTMKGRAISISSLAEDATAWTLTFQEERIPQSKVKMRGVLLLIISVNLFADPKDRDG